MWRASKEGFRAERISAVSSLELYETMERKVLEGPRNLIV